MEFDDILKQVGEFGRYQKVKYFLVCLVGMTTALHALASVFTIYTPTHRCSLPSTAYNGTDTWASQSEEHYMIINMHIPTDSEGDYESCKLYVYDEDGMRTNNTEECNSWVYDTSERINSIVTDWNLVCNEKLHATISSAIFMFGNLCGSPLCGVLSDWLGRRKTLLIGLVGLLISGTVMSFAPEFFTYTIFRFFSGMFNTQVYVVSFVLGLELVGPKYRLAVGLASGLFWTIGVLLLIGFAYAIRIWRYVQLAMTLPIILFTSYYWLMPESARWLLTKGRTEEAEEVLLNAAKVNGKELQAGMVNQLKEPKKAESPKALLKAPRLLIRTAIIIFNWFVISMTYFGLSLNSGNLPGSLYVNFTVSAMAELVGFFLCFFCHLTGRKPVHSLAVTVGGLSLIGSIPILFIENATESQKNIYLLALNFVGKLGVTIGFNIIYIWSAEIFPTVLRTSLLGASSTFARVGSIFAPVIADIGKLVPGKYKLVLPPLIFGIFTITGGLLSIALPETTNQHLPDTIEEANIFPKKLKVEVEEDDFIDAADEDKL